MGVLEYPLLRMEALKLTVEPVPVISVGKSLSVLLPSSRWGKIRKVVYADYGHRCAICGSDPKALSKEKDPWKLAPKACRKELERHGEWSAMYLRAPKYRLECHEVWKYNEETNIQSVSDLIPLCTPCHQIKHWRWAATKLQPPPEFNKKVRRGEFTLKEVNQETRRLFKESLLGGDIQGAKQYLVKGRPFYFSWDDEEFARSKEREPHRYTLEDHFMSVNGCGLNTLVKHVEEAAELCFRRSLYDWQVDFGEFALPSNQPIR